MTIRRLFALVAVAASLTAWTAESQAEPKAKGGCHVNAQGKWVGCHK
jgi:hypothetical protein